MTASPLTGPSELIPLGAALAEAESAIRKRSTLAPVVGVVLGSGLGAFGDSLDDRLAIPYADVPHMPRSTIVGHAGNLCLGRVGGVPSRVCKVECTCTKATPPDRVTFGVRLLAKLGCRAVLLTNAAGGMAAPMSRANSMLLIAIT